MNLEKLMIPCNGDIEKTMDFVRSHTNDDTERLAFEAQRHEGVDVTFAMNQIIGRKTALSKLPSWASIEDIVYPPHISMEQCSSEDTARYKSIIITHFIDVHTATFVDLTGGFGVDFSFLAQSFKEAVYVERQQHLCEIAAHNLPLLGLPHAHIVNEEVSTDNYSSILSALPAGDGYQGGVAVFMDPARRSSSGGRTYAIADCEPNILLFIDDLLRKAEVVMLKLSPMLDWHAAVADINRVVEGHDAVREVHIVAVKNECKELLLVLSTHNASPFSIHCINDGEVFGYAPMKGGDGANASLDLTTPPPYLFVPNASIMKAGCFHELEHYFSVKQIAPSSHLFVGDTDVLFPGKRYHILSVSKMNKRSLQQALAGIERANISCRNFPLKPEELRKRLKLKDGGEHHLFATTTAEGEHVILITKP